MAANRVKPIPNAKNPSYDNEVPTRVRPKFEGPIVKNDGSLADDSVRREEFNEAQKAEDASPVTPSQQPDDNSGKKEEKK